mmetsp:Transcript_22046/g.48132  ORF Transcript_22046/g.48132 Transcript_22046/m.48132 type:complete len:479 (+) Transcript_22046:161-1597(+)
MTNLISKAVQLLNPACFFFISVAYKLAWTAISSLLSQFSRDYGPEVLLQLNIAYFFPSIPVLVLQTVFNDAMDQRLGLPMAALIRFMAGLGGLALLTSYFTYLATSHASLVVTTALVGASYGIAFGTSYQLASKFSAYSTVALTTGFVSSGPVVLFLDLWIKQGTYYSEEGLQVLFSWVGFITACGLAAACWLLLANWKMLAMHRHGAHRVELRLPNKGSKATFGMSSGTRKLVPRKGTAGDSPYLGYADTHHTYSGAAVLDIMENGGNQLSGRNNLPPIGGSGGGNWDKHDEQGAYHHHGSDEDEDKGSKRDVPLLTLAWRISPAALSIFLSVGTSMVIFPFFTYMRSTGLFGDRLAQVLFYVRLISDILGRVVPKRLQATSIRGLMFWALLKTALMLPLFVSIFHPEALLGDVGATILVAAFWLLSGFVNTCSYLVAPCLVSPQHKARASGLMTVAFQSSCFIALLIASAIQKMSF